LLARSLLARSS